MNWVAALKLGMYSVGARLGSHISETKSDIFFWLQQKWSASADLVLPFCKQPGGPEWCFQISLNSGLLHILGSKQRYHSLNETDVSPSPLRQNNGRSAHWYPLYEIGVRTTWFQYIFCSQFITAGVPFAVFLLPCKLFRWYIKLPESVAKVSASSKPMHFL